MQYSFTKHLDVYGGISNSQASGGVSGYINDDLASDWGPFEVLGYFKLSDPGPILPLWLRIVAVGVLNFRGFTFL